MTSTKLPLFTTCEQGMAPGRCLQAPVAAGTVIQVVQGRLQLTLAPRWLGETMVWSSVHLDEGQAQRVDQSGWLMLQAAGDGEVRWLRHVPVSAWARVGRRWAAWMPALRRAGRAVWGYVLGGASFARRMARRARLSGGQISEAL
jgi:hypothetical protein